jgi:hypothetical protein
MKRIFTFLFVFTIILFSATTKAQITINDSGDNNITNKELSFCSSPQETIEIMISEKDETSHWEYSFKEGTGTITLSLANDFTFGNKDSDGYRITADETGDISVIKIEPISTVEIKISFTHTAGTTEDNIYLKNIIINTPDDYTSGLEKLNIKTDFLNYKATPSATTKPVEPIDLHLTSTKPTLNITETYCYTPNAQTINFSGTSDCDDALILQKWVVDKWVDKIDPFTYDKTINLTLEEKVRVITKAGRYSDAVTFDNTYLEKPVLTKTAGDLDNTCWYETIKCSASYDGCELTGSPDFRLVFTGASGVKDYPVSSIDDPIEFNPTEKGSLKLVAKYSDNYELESDNIVILNYIGISKEFELSNGGTYPYDQGNISMLDFFENDIIPDISNEKSIQLNLGDGEKSYLTYYKNDEFYKFIFPYETINNHYFNTETPGVTYNYGTPNQVKFLYGVKTTNKTCFEKLNTTIFVLREKIFIPEPLFCSNDGDPYVITIDKENDSYIANQLDSGYTQTVSFKDFSFEINETEIAASATTFSISGDDTKEKITFKPSNLFISGQEQVLVEITANLNIEMYYEVVGDGFIQGWSTLTNYAKGDSVQYNGRKYKANRDIPIEVTHYPLDTLQKLTFEENTKGEATSVTTKELVIRYLYPSPSSGLFWTDVGEYNTGSEKKLISQTELPFANESFYIFKPKENARLDLDDEYCRSNNLIEINEINSYTITGILKHSSTEDAITKNTITEKWEFKPEELINSDLDSTTIKWDLLYEDNHGCSSPKKEINFKLNEYYGYNPREANLGLDSIYCPKVEDIQLKKSSNIYSFNNIIVNLSNSPIDTILNNKFNPSNYWNYYDPSKDLKLSFEYRHINGCAYKDTMETTIDQEHLVNKNAEILWDNAGSITAFDTTFCKDSFAFPLTTLSYYSIDSIFGVGIYDLDGAYYFNPDSAGNITSTDIHLHYTDNASGCPYYYDHPIKLSASYVDNSSGLLFLESNYCAINNDFELQTINNHTIESIDGKGIFTRNDTLFYNPFTALNSESAFNYSSTDLYDTINVYFHDSKNCKYDKDYSVKISPSIAENSGGLINFDTQYCKYGDSIELASSYLIDSIHATGVYEDKTLNKWFLNPSHADFTNNLQNQNVDMRYYYKDRNNCVWYKDYNFDVYARPNAGFEYSELCFRDNTLFNDTSIFIANGNITERRWDFGNGVIKNGTESSPTLIYQNHGIYPVSLQLTTDKSCTHTAYDTIVIGNYPEIGFKFENLVHNNLTSFENTTTTPDYDTVVNYIWNFDDPTSANYIFENELNKNIDYTFISSGVHDVSLQAISNNNCVSDTNIRVPIFPYIDVNNTNTYLETFNSTETGWLPAHSFDKGLPSGWKQQTVTGDLIKEPITEGMIWQTGDPVDEITDEHSWVESPCFNINGLDFPLLTLDVFQSTESGRDGAVVQYSINDGKTWKLLGRKEEGVNWYNESGIVSNPGDQSGTGNIGWSVNNHEWQSARYPLSQLKQEAIDSSALCIRFRIAYSSDAGNINGINAQGFAFDNFTLANRSRIVMMEQFVNSAYDKQQQQDEEAWLDAFVAEKDMEVVDMRYHNYISHKIDPLFNINPPDISARAMEYGATMSQLTMVDGIYRCEANAQLEASTYFLERTLTDKSFDIVATTQIDGENLVVNADITKLKDELNSIGSEKCVVRMAIVQKKYVQGTETYNNVLVELLPNGEGNVVATIPADLQKGETIAATGTWKPNVSTIGNNFRLVIYVQGIWGVDEIHQVWFKDLVNVPQATVTAPVENLDTEETSSFNIYPSPVKDELNIVWSDILENPVHWKLISTSGSIVKEGITSAGNVKEQIDTYEINEGIYLLVTKNKDVTEKQKILIMK